MDMNTESRTGRRIRAARWSTAVLVPLLLCTGALTANVASAQETATTDQEHETRGQEIREEVRDAHWRHPRLRLGVDGVGGGFAGAIHGGVGGLAVRIGVQLNDLVAIYVQGQGLVGEYVPDPQPTSLIGFAFHSLVLEATLLDMIQVGAGPSLDVIWGCTAANGGTWCGRSGGYFGGDFRVAFIAFHHGEPHRRGLALSVDMHPTWMDGQLVGTFLFGIGGEMY